MLDVVALKKVNQMRPEVDELVEKIKSINMAMESQEPIFGVRWDKSSNPTLERTDAAINMVANVGEFGDEDVVNDFDSAPIFGEMHNPNYEEPELDQWIRIPKFYIRKQDGPKYKSIQVSKNQYPGFYLPKVFWDFEKNKELDYFDFGKHVGYVTGNKLYSHADKIPTVATNIVNFRQYAKSRGKGYQILDIHAIDVLRTLMFVEFATLDIQTVMRGYTVGRYSADDKVAQATTGNYVLVDEVIASRFKEGQSISIGSSLGGNQRFYGRKITKITPGFDDELTQIQFDGEPVDIQVDDIIYNTAWETGFSPNIKKSQSGYLIANDGKYPCAYRGIENPFGDIFEWVDGININERQTWVADNVEDYASNLFAHPYRKIDYVNSMANGYVAEMGFDVNTPYAEFPTEVGATGTTYYSDYYYQSTGQRVARFGGSWSFGGHAGLSSWDLVNASSASSVLTGARLLRKPL